MRICFRFTKLGKIRFTSQRDVARMWERALRRAQMPLAYTQGFSPRPQLSFGLALPTGCESLAEYLDVALDPAHPDTPRVAVGGLAERLTTLLPEGITVEAAATIERRPASLQQLVTSCAWSLWFSGLTAGQLEDRVASLLACDSVLIERERKGRQAIDDLRPSVLSLAVAEDQTSGRRASPGLVDPVRVEAVLATQPRGVRPIELVRGLIAVSGPANGEQSGPTAAATTTISGVPVLDRACRTQQWIERDGIREEPLERRAGPTGSDRALHALERAS